MESFGVPHRPGVDRKADGDRGGPTRQAPCGRHPGEALGPRRREAEAIRRGGGLGPTRWARGTQGGAICLRGFTVGSYARVSLWRLSYHRHTSLCFDALHPESGRCVSVSGSLIHTRNLFLGISSQFEHWFIYYPTALIETRYAANKTRTFRTVGSGSIIPIRAVGSGALISVS